MRALLRLAQQRADVEPLGRIAAIVMEHHPAHRREQVELVAERGALLCAGAVIEAELGVAALEFGDHRHDRGDADAAGQEEVTLGLRGEREMVARQRHLDDIADPHLIMQMAGRLAELLAQHRDAIAPSLGRVVPQRIIAPYLFA
jgi:hypothetical protein